MPISFNALSELVTPSFISENGSDSCSIGGIVPAFIYHGSFNNPTDLGGSSFSDTNALSLCSFSKALAKDVYNSVADSTNNSLKQIATALNQTLDVLRCLGFSECELVGPSSCCPTSGGKPATISIKLPRNLIGQNVCYTTQGVIEGGAPDNGNNIIINPVKANNLRFM